MKRFIIDKLEQWKNSPRRKPLIIYGARQVGKTWAMKEFGKQFYKKVAYFSFYNNPRVSQIFDNGIDLDQIIISLNIEAGFEITPEDTLIIFDEIQNNLRVLESLKYFNENANQYHIIAAGSLLGVAIHEGVSFPVGKVDTIQLYPMNFLEFLYAIGKGMLADRIIAGDAKTFDSFSDELIFLLKNYLYIGGMPEVVNFYVKHKNYSEIRKIQNSIINQYTGDFRKHIPIRDIPRVKMVWNAIPMQLAKENKKFFFGKMKKGARSADFEVAIQWLQDAGLIYKVHKVSAPHIPLKAYMDFSAFKIFTLDVGLLGALSDLNAKVIIEKNDIFSEFKGALTEQFILQEMLSQTQYVPYYYSSDTSTLDIDFLIQQDDNVVPIEVKASSNVNSPSLKTYFSKFEPKKVIRFSTLKFKEQDRITNIPLYAVSLINMLAEI